MIRVPLLFARPDNRLWYLVLWAPYIALYQLSNRFLLTTPGELPMTALDQAIPFVPELLPLYVAYVPFCLWSLSRSEDDDAANRVFYASYFQMAVCLPFFLLLPVRFPRELFYGPELYGWADAFWRWFDEPHNCLPSLHAANCLLLMYLNWRRPLRIPYTAVAVGIILSTVLVKQHYVVDLLAGAVVFAATLVFVRYLQVGTPDQARRPSRACPRAYSPSYDAGGVRGPACDGS